VVIVELLKFTPFEHTWILNLLFCIFRHRSRHCLCYVFWKMYNLIQRN